MNNSHDKVTIKIPRNLYHNVNEIIEDSGFDSATDFIVYVLRALASTKAEKGESLSQKEVEIVKRRLKNLGYL